MANGCPYSGERMSLQWRMEVPFSGALRFLKWRMQFVPRMAKIDKLTKCAYCPYNGEDPNVKGA